MRRYVLGDTPGAGAWRLENVPDSPLGTGEVRVEMRAWSLNARDLLVATGDYGGKHQPGLIPLSDGAGEVSQIGTGVTRFKPGDRVVNCFFRDWVEGPLTPAKGKTSFGGAVPGVLAERVVLPESALVAIPDGLSFEEASTLPCAGVTAWNALFDTGGLMPGQTVLVQGTGGVSIFALQFAKAAGCRVLITSSSDAKLGLAHELGADAGVNYVKQADWDRFAFEQTGGEGVELVLEVGGTDTVGRSLRAVRYGGKIVVIGVLSGRVAEVPLGYLFTKNVQMIGIYVGSRRQFEAMSRFIELNSISPVVDRVFRFEEAPAALRHLESAAHMGKIVIAR